MHCCLMWSPSLAEVGKLQATVSITAPPPKKPTTLGCTPSMCVVKGRHSPSNSLFCTECAAPLPPQGTYPHSALKQQALCSVPTHSLELPEFAYFMCLTAAGLSLQSATSDMPSP